MDLCGAFVLFLVVELGTYVLVVSGKEGGTDRLTPDGDR